MSKPPAAITAQIVDQKNDARHKGFIQVILHIPEEQRDLYIAALGWGTYTNPIPVAIAQLREPMEESNERIKPQSTTVAYNRTTEKPAKQAAPASRAKRSFDELSMTNQAGILCSDPAFHAFLCEEHSDRWKLLNKGSYEERATLIVHSLCGVDTRRHILPNTEAATGWRRIISDYLAWKRVPEFV